MRSWRDGIRAARALLWRSAVAGLALVAVLSPFPPIVRYRVPVAGRAGDEAPQTALATTSIESQRATAVSQRAPEATIRPKVASIVLWFHPLAWRIRAAHAAACDAVSDAVAADFVGDVASYGRTLARLAIRSAHPTRAHGLAMARTSDIRRRLDELNRMVFRSKLSSKTVCIALFMVTVLLVFIGGFGFTRAEQAAAAPKATDAAAPADPKPAGRLTLRAVAAETGLPI